MKASLEIRASVWALTAGLLALGSAWLMAERIQLLPGRAMPVEAASPPVVVSTAPKVLHEGADHFAMSCSECHGDDAHGDEGPDLHNLPISNARIGKTIRNGIKGEMPSFARKYNEAQIAALVSYLRSLR